jgi:dihydrofolate reductase
MARLRVHNVTVSVDGFMAGPDQSLDHPLGVGGGRLHEWVLATRTGYRLMGLDGGSDGVDEDYAAQGEVGIGATIMGRNMFGPIRGPWRTPSWSDSDQPWNGWWGAEPPFHHPVFVLTHHPRPSVTMAGGTTFYFVTGGIHDALDQARAAAGDLDIRLGGGASNIAEYLRAGLVDYLHLVIAPVLLGTGERLLDGDVAAGYTVSRMVGPTDVTHVEMVRAAA